MAFTAPTAAEFKAAYSAFSAVEDATVEAALAYAFNVVPQTLPGQAIYTEAAGLFTAHELTLRGEGTGTEADMVRQGVMGMSSVSDGATSFSRRQIGDGTDPMQETLWGRRYQALVRRYAVPFSVVTGT